MAKPWEKYGKAIEPSAPQDLKPWEKRQTETTAPPATEWQDTQYGFKVRNFVTTDTGKPTVQREDGAVWYGPEQGNTGKAGWFQSSGLRAGSGMETTGAGLTGAVVRGVGPYAAGVGAGGAIAGPPGAAVGVAATGLAKLVGDPLTQAANDLGIFNTKQWTTSEAIQHGMDWLGITPATTPSERVVQAGSEAVGGAMGGLGLGQVMQRSGSPVVQGVGQQLASNPAQQLLGAATGGVSSQVASEMGVGKWGQLGAGLAGSLVGGLAPKPSQTLAEVEREAVSRGLIAPAAQSVEKEVVSGITPSQLNMQAKKAAEGGIGSSKAKTILATEAAPNPKTLQAAKRLGIEDYLQPDHVTTNQAFRELSQAVKSVPGSSTRAAEIIGLNQIGERAERLIVEMGGRNDLSRMSDSVRSRIDGTITQLSKAADDAYSAIDTKIPKQTRGPADSILDFVKQRAEDLDGVDNLSPIESTILKKLSPVVDESGATRNPTYALIDSVRKDIGDAAKAKGPFADANTGLAKYLYKLIDEDQAKIATDAGLGDAYKAAKEVVKMRKGFEDDMISIYGKNLDQSLVGKLDSATMSLSKGDADKLAKIMKSIPQDMRKEVAASALKTAFGNATQNGKLNFNTFAKWYDGLLENKQAYTALMSNLGPQERKAVSDMYRVSKNISLATRERITTGRIQAIQQEIQGADNLLSSVYGVAKRTMIGIPLEGATTMMGLPGAGIASALGSALTRGKPNTMKLADELISSPQFLDLIRETSKKGTPSRAQSVTLAKSPAYKRFANAAGVPTESESAINWIMSAIRGEQAAQEEKR